MQLVNKYSSGESGRVEENISNKPQILSIIEHFAKAREEHGGDPILSKKTYRLADKELLVLIMKPSSKIKVLLATNLNEPVTLHWALSKNSGEWLVPPSNVLPPGSVLLDKASETQFKSSSSSDQPYKIQSLEIEIEDDSFVGMPFVLLSGGNWIKNKGSDFYVEFGVGSKQVQKDPSDGKGTTKALLDKIAGLESEAQDPALSWFEDLEKAMKKEGI